MIDNRVKKYLKKNKVQDNRLYMLPKDASNRSYFRLSDKKLIALFPSEFGESIEKFVQISNILKKNNIKIPKIIDYDKDLEILLIEDFGENKISNHKYNISEKELLKKVIDVIFKIQKITIQDSIDEFNLKSILDESQLFIDWYLVVEKKLQITKEASQAFHDMLEDLYIKFKIKNNVYIHKDFHVDNIFYLPNIKDEIAIIDYQDMNIGHISYDILSLLQDVRKPLEVDTENLLLDYFLTNNLDFEKEILDGYNFFSFQRNLKIIGIFARLKNRDNKDKYMNLIENGKKFIIKILKKPEFLSAKKWFDKYFKEIYDV